MRSNLQATHKYICMHSVVFVRLYTHVYVYVNACLTLRFANHCSNKVADYLFQLFITFYFYFFFFSLCLTFVFHFDFFAYTHTFALFKEFASHISHLQISFITRLSFHLAPTVTFCCFYYFCLVVVGHIISMHLYACLTYYLQVCSYVCM